MPQSYGWDIIGGPSLDAVIHALQLWYRHHLIWQYLAWQTRRHLAVTTIQCWKRCIWLDRWFAQQSKKRLRLCLLCRGALAYAMSVQGSQHSSPTPTDTPSNLKALRHPFRDRGQPQLPLRKRSQQRKRHRCCRGRRTWLHAPHHGGGPLCTPLCFWAAQTMDASDLLGANCGASMPDPRAAPTGSSMLTQAPRHMASASFSPDAAAITIQTAYRRYYLSNPELCP